MIGWFLAGAMLGARKQKLDKRRAARREAVAAHMEANRKREPRPAAAWVIFALLSVALVLAAGPAALPVVIIGGVLVWSYQRKRREEHAAWLAEQEEKRAAEEAKAAVEAEWIVRGWRPPAGFVSSRRGRHAAGGENR